MIEGLKKLKVAPFSDHRGIFAKTFNIELHGKLGLKGIEEYFFSRSNKFVWRGMHLQVGPHASNRLITCTNGSVIDFLYDLRVESPTFLQLDEVKMECTGQMDAVFVPAGVAHGFLSLSDGSEMHYISDKMYNEQYDTGVNPMSIPNIKRYLIKRDVSISNRDLNLLPLEQFIERNCK